ncbi:MAG TPA: FAD-dependent oxidoreductase [Phycisphaerae bacterium]|nr:FAD-dependent oxidoreductase [Phycisphaerae bacterium]
MHDYSTDILIVGAGLAGASTAYHLKRLSDARVLIVEKETTPGVHSSGRNASFIRERTEEPELRPLTSEGAEFLRGGTLAEYNAHGSVLIGWGDEDARLHCAVARGKGLWCPRDGTADVARLLQSYLAGQKILSDTEVLEWAHEGDGIRVRTNRGVIACSLLVNAAGPWAGKLGRLPLTPKNRTIYVTPPMKWVDPKWPFVWDVYGGLYFRPESGGLLLSPCDERPAEPGEYTDDPRMAEQLAEKVMRLQPDLSEISIQRSWVGQRTFAKDKLFVIGFDPRESKLFHVAGLGGHGVTSSYAVGRLAAETILGKADRRGTAFAPARLL